MYKNMHVTRIVALCLAITIPSVSLAASVYKWVDKNGKVYYSESPPPKGETSKVKIPPPSANDEPVISQGMSVRDPDGKCLTIKCIADEMETSRLARERSYVKQRAENERVMQPKTESAPQWPPQDPLYSDGYMRTQCLHGQCGSDTRDCEDINKLRECAAMQRAQRDFYQENHGAQ